MLSKLSISSILICTNVPVFNHMIGANPGTPLYDKKTLGVNLVTVCY